MRRLRLRADAVRWREIGDEVIAVDLEESTYLSTNRTGTLLWRLLVGGATREELVGALVDGFGIAATAAEADVDLFVEQLGARSLLET
jgi:hypothetical protein